jgi:hypothetical protein
MVLFSSQGWAYPIYPLTISDVYKGSELVIYGKVIRFEDIKNRNNIGEELPPPPSIISDSRAVIQVIEVLKGVVRETEICVSDDRGMVCPTPFYFEEGHEVVLFLKKSEDSKLDVFYCFGLSYGGKDVTKEEYVIYKQKIQSLQAILSIPNIQERERRYIDWTIGCVKEPLTEWDGMFELRNEKRMDYPSRDITANPYKLTAIQNKELCEFVYSKKRIDDVSIDFIRYLYQDNENKELIDFLIKLIKSTEVNWANLYDVENSIDLIATSANREDLTSLYKKIKETDGNKKKQKLIMQFIKKI